MPPSSLMMLPVTNALALLDKNRVKPAISCALPNRPTGWDSRDAAAPASVRNWYEYVILLGKTAGAMPFTLIASSTKYAASDCVILLAAALLAA